MDYIGLASDIISFIEVGCKVAKCCHDIRNSATGATETNYHVERITSDLEGAARSLRNADFTQNDEQLCAMAKECEKLSTKLIGILQGLQPSRPGKLRALWKSIVAYFCEDEVRRLDDCLSSYRQQLVLRLQLLMLYVKSVGHLKAAQSF
jgi:hypothetical protein